MYPRLRNKRTFKVSLIYIKFKKDKANLLKDTLYTFEGDKQIKDYHGIFNSSYWIMWMKKLLKYLKTERISNGIIVLVNVLLEELKNVTAKNLKII